MAQQSYISLPIVGGTMLATGTTFVAGKVLQAGTMDSVTMRLGVGPASGEQVVFRVGTNVEGTLNEDYVQVTFTDTASAPVEIIDENVIQVEADAIISWKVQFQSVPLTVEEYSGSVRITSTAAAISEEGAYTTLSRVKENLGLGTLTIAQDDSITEIIVSVSSLFDTIYGDRFVQREIGELRDGSPLANGIPLYIEPSEVQSDRGLATLFENGVELTSGEEWILDAANNRGSRMVWRTTGPVNTSGRFNARFATGFRNIKIVYRTWPSVTPADVALAATEETIRYFMNTQIPNATDGLRIGIASRSPETGTSLNYTENDLLPATVRMLNAYRRRRFPG